MRLSPALLQYLKSYFIPKASDAAVPIKVTLVPGEDGVYDLGSSGLRFNAIYTRLLETEVPVSRALDAQTVGGYDWKGLSIFLGTDAEIQALDPAYGEWYATDTNKIYIATDTTTWVIIDLDAMNIKADPFWYIDGYLATLTQAGATFVSPHAFTILKVVLYIEDAGRSGNTTIDLNIDGVSMFSTPPSIAFDDADGIVEVVPDTFEINEGEVITLDIDAIAPGAKNLTVRIVTSSEPHTQNHSHNSQGTISFWGTAAVGENPLRMGNFMGANKTLKAVYLTAGTAPTGSALIVDVKINGSTIFSTSPKPQIDAGAQQGGTATLDTTTWVDGNYITAEITQVGSTIPGSDVVVHVVYS